MNSTIVRSERVAAGAARAGLETAPESGAQAGSVSGQEAETTSGWLWHRSIRGLFPFARLHVARALRNRGVLAASAPVPLRRTQRAPDRSRAAEFPVGTVCYALPRHVCPTVALHEEAVVVRDGRAVDRWHVAARTRRISV